MNWQTSSTRTLGLSLAIAGVLALGLAPAAARADDPDTAPVADSGQAPGVARISNVQSNVAIKRGDSGDTVAAAINAPVMSGDYLTTGDDSRAEVQFDNADMLRAGSNAQLRFTQLGSGGDTTQLAAGTVELRAFQQSTPLEIDTPSITVRPTDAGSYRVTVDESGNTFVTVRHGDASVVTPQGTQALGPGSTLEASGSAANPQITTVGTVALDEFDNWNNQRDSIVASATREDSQYVNQGVVGASDLAADGTWQDDSTYGNVWVPNNVAVGWSPYTDGQWAWEGYYGWTWVSYEPWGWAPYHYGRWFYAANRWAWYPGPRYVRPVWSPALVGFFGFGGGGGVRVGVGVGFGNIGWVPLAPFEAYHPWYGRGGYSVTNINISINSYRNYYAPGAISGISVSAWNNGWFNHRAVFTPGTVHEVYALHGAVPIAPTRSNLAFSRQAVNATNLPRPTTVAFTGFASHTVTNRVPFEQERAQAQAVSQHAYASSTQSPVRTGSENQSVRTEPSTGTDAWSRFNSQHVATPSSSGTRASYSNTDTRSNTYNTSAVHPTYSSASRPTYSSTTHGSYSNNYRSYDTTNTNNRGGTYNSNYRGSYNSNYRGNYTSPPRYQPSSGSHSSSANSSHSSSSSSGHGGSSNSNGRPPL